MLRRITELHPTKKFQVTEVTLILFFLVLCLLNKIEPIRKNLLNYERSDNSPTNQTTRSPSHPKLSPIFFFPKILDTSHETHQFFYRRNNIN